MTRFIVLSNIYLGSGKFQVPAEHCHLCLNCSLNSHIYDGNHTIDVCKMLSNLEKQPHHKWKNEYSPQLHTVSKHGSWTMNVFSKWSALQPLFQSSGSFGNLYPTNRDFPLGEENHPGTKSRPQVLWWKSSCALWSVPPVDSALINT